LNLNQVMLAEGVKMTLNYQGKKVETSDSTVYGFLAARGIVPATVLVEYKGEVYSDAARLAKLPLEDGAELNVFHIVAGG